MGKTANWKKIIIYCSALFLAFIILAPFYWLVISSLKTPGNLLSARPTFIPRPFTLAQYRHLFSGNRFVYYIINSVIVASVTTSISLVISIFGAYSLTRLKYPGRRALSQVILLTYMFPGVLLLIPLYRLLASIGMLNSLIGVIMVYTTWCAPLTTWILIAFFKTIPKELEEAAMIDGTTRVGALFRVILPISKPGIATGMLFSFVSCWNEYPIASVILLTDKVKTLPVGLGNWIGLYTTDWGILMAGAIIIAIPVLLIVTFMQKYFISGLSEGAVKF